MFKELVKKTVDKILNILPYVWGTLVIAGVTAWLIAVPVLAIKLILKLFGVM